MFDILHPRGDCDVCDRLRQWEDSLLSVEVRPAQRAKRDFFPLAVLVYGGTCLWFGVLDVHSWWNVAAFVAMLAASDWVSRCREVPS
jgi:hypothetical protein